MPKFMPIVKNIVKDITAGRRKVFEKFMALLPHARSKFATIPNCQNGFDMTGIWPPNPEKNCQLIPTWDMFSIDQKKYIVQSTYLVALQMMSGHVEGGKLVESGVADDNYMEFLLGELFGPVLMGVNNKPAKGKKTSDLALNRWRATFIFNKGVREKLRSKIFEQKKQKEA
jgi:hypothetical protein